MTDQLHEAGFYVLFAAFFGSVLLILTCLVYSLGSFLFRRRPSGRMIARIVLTFALVFLAGIPANGLWYAAFTERLYHDADPLARFLPFMPFALDTSCGAYLHPGVTYVQMEALWLIFATACWLLGFIGARKLTLRITGNAGDDTTPKYNLPNNLRA